MHCPLCFLGQRQNENFGLGEMPFATVRAAIENALKEGLREVIPSTMGEPLLYSHFSELLELCVVSGVPVNLTTNGSFPGTWGTEQGMRCLLRACRDIKVSCMGFSEESFSEMMPGGNFSRWKANVEKLVALANARLADRESAPESPCSVSLQVTLHRKNAGEVLDMLRWAESVGISRIKWNPAVFLSTAPAELVARYALGKDELHSLRQVIRSDKLRCEGSLFFVPDMPSGAPNAASYGSDAPDFCPFDDELWVLPDGSMQHCPNPERRYGDPAAPAAQCSRCPLRFAPRRSR
jgi:MoaA/NifB/PqqE/SkfB family radical SAM enzyme